MASALPSVPVPYDQPLRDLTGAALQQANRSRPLVAKGGADGCRTEEVRCWALGIW